MFRSKTRTVLTIIAIFIGAFTITLTIGISSGISSYIDKQVSGIGAKDILIIEPKITVATTDPQKYDPNNKSMSAQSALLNGSLITNQDIAKIEKQSGIYDVKPFIAVSPEYISGANSEKYQISIQQYIDGCKFDLVAGRLPDNNSEQLEILLPVNFVSVLGYSSNETATNQPITIAIKNSLGKQKSVTAIISGIQQESIMSRRGGASANLALINKLFNIQTQDLPSNLADNYMGAVAKFDTSISKDDLQSIKDSLKDKGYIAQTVEDQIGIIKQIIDAITSVLIFFGAIALLAASFGIINTLYMSVQERTKEIGLMKAMGMSRAKVFLLFSIEAILIGFWGSLIGAAAAIGIGQIINRVAADSFLKDLPGFDLTSFPILSVVSVVSAVIFVAFLAGTLPSRRAANQDPIEALRYE
jgi:putative ABC transport system permease protein